MPIVHRRFGETTSIRFATTNEVVLTSGTAAKGAWVEVSTSTTLHVNYLIVELSNSNTTNIYDVDIGTGAAGSEVVLIPNIHFHIDITGNRVIPLIYPLKTDIAQGTRISCRTQATNNTDTIEAVILCTGF